MFKNFFSKSGSKKPTIYLHIGRHKTGTSSLQNFFLRNRDLLKEKDCYYPETGLTPTSGQAGLAWCFRFRQDSYDIYNKLHKEIAASGCSNIVISSEAFLEPGVFEDLVFNNFQKEKYDVKVVVYVRRQDLFIESAYKQAVKGGGRVCLIEDYKCRANHAEVLEPWEKNYGVENIILRPFEKTQFVGGSIYSDFLNILGLDIDDFSIPDKSTNTSPSLQIHEVIRFVNKAKVPQDKREKIVKKLLQVDDFENNPNCTLISPEDAISIVEKYEGSNRELAKRYYNREDLFFEKIEKNEQWEEFKGVTKEDIARKLVEAWPEN